MRSAPEIQGASARPPPVQFTPEQRAAVDARTGSLLLHAAAGSGKTSVLVERFARAVLDDGVGVDRILVITFTDKAAAELRARIRERLLELGAGERAREAEGAWLATFHGFCARLLRSHALAAGLDPEFAVLDEVEADRVGAEAFDRALEAFLAGGTSAQRVELVAAYAPDRLETTVRTIYDRLRSRGERRPALPDAAEPPIGAARERLARAVRAARARLEPKRGSGATVDAALERLAECDEALAAVEQGEAGDPWRFAELRVRRGGVAALRVPELDELAAAHQAWVEACAARRSVPDLRLLQGLLDLYGERYAEAKDECSALDFEDLELLARDLLRADAGVRRRTRERFAHVMVDELQDTNRLQSQLLDLVAGDNLFAVGDEHQSIYRFRHADVAVFRKRRAAAEAAGRAARLTTNFRSRPEILDPIGLAFAQALGPGFEPPQAPAGAARARPGAAPSVELVVVDADRGRWEDALGEEPFGASMRGCDPGRAAEARLLARRVVELTAPGGGFGPGDVAVLLRARADVAVYERALSERGVATYVAGGAGYWSQQQVADLRAYLAALANPLDEGAVISVLASPLVGASLDALVVVQQRARALGRGAWWALEAAFCDGGDGSDGLADSLPPPDRERVGAFARRFAAERQAAPRASLETLIDRAVTASGYDRAVLAMPAGERRMANVRKLMRLAREHEARAGRDLRGFIDALDARGLASREGEAPLEGERLDAVRMMSIHTAKGLEFPVVFVADLGRRGRRDDAALRVTDDGRVGLRVSTLGGEKLDGLDLERIKAEQAAADEAEEKRVFYVACTRAREHLVLSGATDLERWPGERELGAPVNWLWRAFAPDLAAGVAAGRAEGESVRPLHDGAARVRWTACSPASVDRVLPAADRAPAAPPGQAARGPAPLPDAARAPRAREGPAPPAGEPPAAHPPAGATAAPPPDGGPTAPPPEGGPAAPPSDGGRAASPEGVPAVTRLSYSALESYRRCGYRFFLERVLRLPPLAEEAAREAGDGALGAADGRASSDGEAANPPAPGDPRQLALDLERVEVGERTTRQADGSPAVEQGLSVLARGSVVHELLERLDFARPEPPSAEAVAERIRGQGVEPRQGDAEEVRGLIDGFLASPLFARVAATGRVRAELPFAFMLSPDDRDARGPGLLVDGVVDLLCAEGETTLVVDYKTDRVGDADLEALCRQSYGTQRLVYALAALRSGAARVEVAHLFLERPHEPVIAAFTPADSPPLEAELRELARGVLAGRFPPSGVPHHELCAGCPGRAALCSWGPERTGAPAPAAGAAPE